jgi:hypothetical protein
MVEKDLILKEQLKFKGLGDFKLSYRHAYDWLIDEEYDITEDKYTEKIKGNAKELKVVWTAVRKITDYFRIRLEIMWEILGMTDVEVEIEGKKKKMNEFGELKLTVKGILEKDYFSKWETSGTQKFLKEIYHKYIIPSRTEQKEIEVYEVVQRFKDDQKAFFDLVCKRYTEVY